MSGFTGGPGPGPGPSMSPALLLVLLLAALDSECTTAPPENSAGLSFVITLPESIAYYHPDKPDNYVRIFALYDTWVTIRGEYTGSMWMETGQVWGFTTEMEYKRQSPSDKTIRITSDEKISVQVISVKNNSVQTTLVLPTDQLAKEYPIPPVPKIIGTTHPTNTVTTQVVERAPFKLTVINGDEANTVTAEGDVPVDEFDLPVDHIAQIWLKEDNNLQVVKATLPVTVLFGHPCALRDNCTCGQLYTMLPPAKTESQKFYIPALPFDDGGEKFILLSENQIVQPFNPDSPLVEAAGIAILYRPGLLLPLIPETDFAACYVLDSLDGAESYIVIVVHKDFPNGVHIGDSPLESPDWKELKSTEYVSTFVSITSGKKVIWHSSSTMAVYLVGEKLGSLFGMPAPIISRHQDFRGCILSPEVVKIGDVAGGWRESQKYCKDNSLELVSFPDAQLQTQVYNKINNDSLQEVWIGMRRSSQTGEWYWLSGKPVNDTNWEEGEPGTVHEGQCAIMSLEIGKDNGWKDEDCCKAAHPVCYKSPTFYPLE